MDELCDDCGLNPLVACPDGPVLDLPATDPGTILDRLPPALFNLRRPTEITLPALLCGDLVFDATVFGPTGSADVTPQYELARILAVEKDRFLYAWRTAEADQRGLGDSAVPVDVSARGAELDRYWGQFGIHRPRGFTDCCYQRLAQLLLFAPRGLYKSLAIAEMYTGVRPTWLAEPCLLRLIWPPVTEALEGTAFWDDEETAFDDTADVDVDLAQALTSNMGFWDDDADVDGTFWDTDITDESGALGMTLAQALHLSHADGVVIQLLNAPAPGFGGCSGATLRGPVATIGVWAP